MQIHAIILAGGDGNRFGGEQPKQFVRLAGDAILLRTLRRLHGASIGRLVVVSHPRWIDETNRLFRVSGQTVKEGDYISFDGLSGEVKLARVASKPSEILQVVQGTLPKKDSDIYQRFERLLSWDRQQQPDI